MKRCAAILPDAGCRYSIRGYVLQRAEESMRSGKSVDRFPAPDGHPPFSSASSVVDFTDQGSRINNLEVPVICCMIDWPGGTGGLLNGGGSPAAQHRWP